MYAARSMWRVLNADSCMWNVPSAKRARRTTVLQNNHGWSCLNTTVPSIPSDGTVLAAKVD